MDPVIVGLAYCALLFIGLMAMGVGYSEDATWLGHSGTVITAIVVFKLLLIVILN